MEADNNKSEMNADDALSAFNYSFTSKVDIPQPGLRTTDQKTKEEQDEIGMENGRRSTKDSK